MLRHPKAKSKREKCKFQRCMYKKLFPVEKPRYCEKHVGKIPIIIPTQMGIKDKIKAFIWK